ncbi:TIGD4 [Cordylochernes scorpioides]|uniref:TIGD4 n=1 Tax=Cordylochernes scorpioides TaxID=51811 RepID=A0ABY6LRH5_9ARAC|nr:TIGD4 [Cordylochernes scorpioides]
MLEMTRTDPEWEDKIITGYETWVYGYDPETKHQSAEWRCQDIAPNDFFLFPKLKAVLKGRHFDTRDDIIEKSPLALKSIPKEAYKNCFDNWEKRWRWHQLSAWKSGVTKCLSFWAKKNGLYYESRPISSKMHFPLLGEARCTETYREDKANQNDGERQQTNWLTDVMPNIISNYACKDIFNADETGLFWRLLPDKTLHFKGETCTGGKASKERITILLCCNMDGSEKMQPLVIGKAKQPRCFRGIKHLPVQYEANQKAWMTGLLFESWVRHIDKKMAGQHRQIILLLDNCGAHPPDMQGLTNTHIAFLPPNTTSMLQPCDQGIIRNFKMIYRTRLMRKYLTAYDAGTALTINLKQAVDIISVAWNDVLPATISNCWHHSGIIKSDVSSPLDTPQPATQMWEQQSLFDRMKEVLKIPLEMDFDSYADADNDVVTNAMLSDVEIVESILQAKEEEETDQVDEEVDPIVHIPHPK